MLLGNNIIILIKVPQLKLVRVIDILKGDVLSSIVVANKILLKSTSIVTLCSLRSAHSRTII